MSTTSKEEYITGRVKWFNTKKGYGFISATDDPSEEGEIFVHHSEISVALYKYLVQGEYVEFLLAPAANTGKYKFQAAKVRGIKGGKLMCETRDEILNKTSASASANAHTDESLNHKPYHNRSNYTNRSSSSSSSSSGFDRPYRPYSQQDRQDRQDRHHGQERAPRRNIDFSERAKLPPRREFTPRNSYAEKQRVQTEWIDIFKKDLLATQVPNTTVAVTETATTEKAVDVAVDVAVGSSVDL
jgi:CspA family cold shock protein